MTQGTAMQRIHQGALMGGALPPQLERHMKIKGKAAKDAHARMLKRAEARVAKLNKEIEPLLYRGDLESRTRRKKLKQRLLEADIEVAALMAIAPDAKDTRESPSEWRDRVKALLKDSEVPLSIREMTEQLRRPGVPFEVARSIVSNAVRQLHKGNQWGGAIHVAAWVREQRPGMSKDYPAQKFGYGPGTDAPKLKPLTMAEMNQRRRERQKVFVPSVFALGTPAHRRATPAAFNVR